MNISILMSIMIPSIIACGGLFLIVTKKMIYPSKAAFETKIFDMKKAAILQGVLLILFAMFLVLIQLFTDWKIYIVFLLMGTFAIQRFQSLLLKWCVKK